VIIPSPARRPPSRLATRVTWWWRSACGACRPPGRAQLTVPRDPGAPAPESGDARSDRELLAGHVAGDRSAFPELVARHRRRLWNLALRMLRDREDAADALQDAFVRAFRAAENFRHDAEVSTWLHRIMVNVCLTRVAARQKRPVVPLLDQLEDEHRTDLVDQDDAYAATDSRHAMATLLAHPPDEQRLAIVLVDVEGYSVAEAADALGVAPGTIKSRCARGRAKLAAVLVRAKQAAASPGSGLADQQQGGEQR
jgi:RNA polymerase sigma-70 factor, ECF subfamily